MNEPLTSVRSTIHSADLPENDVFGGIGRDKVTGRDGKATDLNSRVGNEFDPGVIMCGAAKPVRFGAVLNKVVAGAVPVDTYPFR